MVLQQDPLVSIIIPIYNSEQYLMECVNSVVAQSYKMIEIILIDDGSMDGSANLCDCLANIDNRIIVIHQSNRGIAIARNTGLNVATGDYVSFVDSDDCVDPFFVETLLANIGDADAIACNMDSLNNMNLNFALKSCTSQNVKTFSKDDLVENYYKNDGNVVRQCFRSPCAKIFKISELRFNPNLPVAEDIVYNLQYLKSAKMVRTVNYTGYYVRNNSYSVTHLIAKRYTPLYEHSCTFIMESICKAELDFGIKKEKVIDYNAEASALRYYYEITNLFRLGSPYSLKEKLKKIRQINCDDGFISNASKKKFCDCSNAEKVAQICCLIKNPIIVGLLIRFIILVFKNA